MLNQGKKSTLIAWINALKLKDSSSIEQLSSLCDGTALISMIKICDGSLEQCDNIPDRFAVIQNYLEGFYHTLITQYVDLEALVHSEDSGVVEWELGKLLLMLFGAFVQEQQRDIFVQAAMYLPEPMQLEVKELIEGIVEAQAPQNTLSNNFSDVLTKEHDATSHRDAALFFKLVANGLTPTPTVERSFNFSTACGRNCSIQNGLNNIRDSPCVPHSKLVGEIDSPLKMLTLTSSPLTPLTPLGALMQSPQLTQKAILRQKEHEIKRLELTLQNERHLTADLEFEIKKNVELLELREMKIRELEKTIPVQRKLRDRLEEMDVLESQKEQLEKEVQRLQAKLDEMKDLKNHLQILEQERKDLMEELEAFREEGRSIDILKKTCEEYRSTSHKQQLKLKEFETILEHRNDEVKQKTEELQQMDDDNKSIRCQRDRLKREKQDLEDQIGVDGVDTGGECMSVIADKCVSDLQAELLQLRNTWIDPCIHNNIIKELEDVTETKLTYETKYVEMRKDLLSKEDQLEKLEMLLKEQKEIKERMETEYQEIQKQMESVRSEVHALQETNGRLLSSQNVLSISKDEAEEKICCLQRELSHSQAELQMALGEIEAQMTVNESRRQTLVKTVDEVVSERKILEHQLSKEQSTWQEKFEDLKDKLRISKEESLNNEEALKTKLQGFQNSLRQCENTLEQERLVKENIVKSQKDEINRLQSELINTQTKMTDEIKTLKTAKNTLAKQLNTEREQYELKNENLSQESEIFLKKAKANEDSLLEKVDHLTSEKQTLDLDIHKLQLQAENTNDNWNEKFEKIRQELEEQRKQSSIEISALHVQKEESNFLQQNLRSELGDLTRTLQTEKENNCSMKSSLQKQKEQVTNLCGKLKHCELVEDRLNEKIKHLNGMFEEELQTKNRVAEEKEDIIRTLKKDLENLIVKLNVTESDGQLKFDELRRKHAELTDKLEEEIEMARNIAEQSEKKFPLEVAKLTNDFEQKINCLITTHKSDVEVIQNEKKVEIKSLADIYEQQKLDIELDMEAMKIQNQKLLSEITDDHNVEFKNSQDHAAQNMEEMKIQNEQLFNDLTAKHNDELKNSLDHAAQNMEEMKIQNEQLLNDLTAKHNDELKNSQDHAAQNFEAVKIQKEELLSDLTAKHNVELKNRQDRSEELLQSMEVMKIQNEELVSDVTAKHNVELKNSQDRTEELLQNMEEMKIQNVQLLNDLTAKHNDELKNSLDHAAQNMEEMKIQNEQLLNDLAAKHNDELKNSRDHAAQNMEEMKIQNEQLLNDLTAKHNDELKNSRDHAAQNMEEMKIQNEQLLNDLTAKHNDELKNSRDHAAQNMEEMKIQNEQLLNDLTAKHNDELKNSQDHAAQNFEAVKIQKEELLSDLTAKHNVELKNSQDRTEELLQNMEDMKIQIESLSILVAEQNDELKNSHEQAQQSLENMESMKIQKEELLCDLTAKHNVELKNSQDRTEELLQSMEAMKIQNEELVSNLTAKHIDELKNSHAQAQEMFQNMENGKDNEISYVAKKIDDLKRELHDLSLAHQTELENLTSTLNKTVEAEVLTTQASVAKCDSIVEEFENLKVKCESDKKNHLLVVEELKNEMDKQELYHKEMEALENRHKEEMHSFIEQLSVMEKDQINIQNELKKNVDALTTVHGEKLAFEEKCANLEKELNEKDIDLEERRRAHSEQTVCLQTEFEQLRTLSLEKECQLLDEVKSVQESSQVRQEDLESALQENKNIVIEKDNELASLSAELESEKSANKELTASLNDKKVELEELITCQGDEEAQRHLKIQEFSNKITEICQLHANEMSDSIKNHEQELNELQARLETQALENNKSYETFEAEKLLNESILNDKEEVINELRQALEHMQLELDQKKEEHSVVSQAHATEISEKEETCKQILTELENQLNSQIVEHDNVLETLKTHFEAQKFEAKSDHEQELKGIIDEMTGSMSEMKELKLRHDSLDATITLLKANLVKEVGKAKTNKKSYEEKIEETEKYWKLQLTQLEEDYHKELQDQKEEYQTQLSDQDMRFESQFQALQEEKEMQVVNQKLAFQDRVAQHENKLVQKQIDLDNETSKLKEDSQEALSKMETDYQGKLNHLAQLLKEEAEEHREILGEVKKYSEKVSLLEQTLGENETELSTQKCHATEVKEEYQNIIQTLEDKVCELKVEMECELEESEKVFAQKEMQIRKDLEGELESMRKEYAAKLSEAESSLSNEKQNHENSVQKLQNEFAEKNMSVCSHFESQLADLTTSIKEQKERYEQQVLDITSEKDAEIVSFKDEYDVKVVEIKEEYELKVHEEIDVKIVQVEQSRDNEMKELMTLYELQQKSLEDDLKSKHQDIDILKAQISSEQELRGNDKSEIVKLKMETADLNSKNHAMYEELQSMIGECTSFKQQLDALDEEKHYFEQEHTALTERCNHMNSLAEQNQGLASQLNNLQQENETLKTTATKLEQQSANNESQCRKVEQRCVDLEKSVSEMMNREKQMINGHEKDIQKASELNQKLRKQLEDKYKETRENTRKFNCQTEQFREQVEQIKKIHDSTTVEMESSQNRREKELQAKITALENDCDELSKSTRKMEEKLKKVDSERNSLNHLNERYKTHYNQKKESIELLEEERDLAKKTCNRYKTKMEKLEVETGHLKTKLQEKVKEAKTLGTEVCNLTTKVDLANEQIREYRHQLDQAGTALLGDNTHFLQTVNGNNSFSEESFMEASLNDSLEASASSQTLTPYSLRPRTRNCSLNSSLGGSPYLRKKDEALRSSARLADSPERTSSHSRRSVSASGNSQGRWMSRSDLDKSITSVDSAKSHSSVPRGTGNFFSCEDEPQEFEWGRLSELQRRNTLCLPHLKSSYPIELQACTEKAFNEEPETMTDLSKTEPRKKRKQDMMTVENAPLIEMFDSSKQQKQTAYHRPGPPTPVHQKTRRNSGKFTPKTSSSGRSRRAESKRTPHRTPKTDENKGSAKKNSRNSIAFSVGFTPKKNKRLTRQTAFIQKQPQKSAKVARRPLGNRNVLQTGL